MGLRCTACGNRTRFDVVETRRTRTFHHYSLGGDLSVEDEEVLASERESVTCRWCGSANVEGTDLPPGEEPDPPPGKEPDPPEDGGEGEGEAPGRDGGR